MNINMCVYFVADYNEMEQAVKPGRSTMIIKHENTAHLSTPFLFLIGTLR